MSCPQIWDLVDLFSSFNRVKAMVERSKDAPLHVKSPFPDETRTYDKDVLTLIFSQSHRIRRLDIVITKVVASVLAMYPLPLPFAHDTLPCHLWQITSGRSSTDSLSLSFHILVYTAYPKDHTTRRETLSSRLFLVQFLCMLEIRNACGSRISRFHIRRAGYSQDGVTPEEWEKIQQCEGSLVSVTSLTYFRHSMILVAPIYIVTISVSSNLVSTVVFCRLKDRNFVNVLFIAISLAVKANSIKTNKANHTKIPIEQHHDIANSRTTPGFNVKTSKPQAAHFFHSLPSGGFTSTLDFLTSSQLVLRVVPPLSE